MTSIKLNLEAIAGIKEIDDVVAAKYNGGSIQLFENDNFNGDSQTFEDSESRLGDFGINDTTSSIIITGENNWVVYQHNSSGGTAITLAPGSYTASELVADTGVALVDLNNNISSIRRRL